MSIKYYHLAKDETPPDEFCVVRDVGGEPSEYVFYVPESDVARLRELVRRAHGCKTDDGCCEDCWGDYGECPIEAEMRELGIKVDE